MRIINLSKKRHENDEFTRKRKETKITLKEYLIDEESQKKKK